MEKKLLATLLADFEKVKATLFKSAQGCLSAGYQQPFFVVSQEAQERLGGLLLAPKELDNAYYYYISYLAFWKEVGWINYPQAKEKYPNPDTICCICWVAADKSSFIHIPYDISKKGKKA